MSSKPSAREIHQEHLYEAAQFRKIKRHEAEVRRLTDERWQRRIDPLMPVSRVQFDPDFDGCVL